MTRKDLTLNEKIELLNKIKGFPQNTTLRSMEKILGIPKTTISRIKNEECTLREKQEMSNLNKRKRLRNGKSPEIEDALLRWFTAVNKRNTPIDGTMLKLKAEEFARKLNYVGFIATEGWLSRWKTRNGIKYKKAHGEKGHANTEEADEWKLNKLNELLKEFHPDNIYNADETGLYYRAMPDGSLTFIEEVLLGYKKAMERITILCCCNMPGTDKKRLLVVGKSLKPRCFNNIKIKNLPVDYEANANAWMTSSIFQTWITKWDEELSKKSRKILLLLDNCPAHPALVDLKNIRIEFLPPKTTSILQPLDMGIIRNLKMLYRRKLIETILENLEDSKVDKNTKAHEMSQKVSILQAIQHIAACWEQITSKTIVNCFAHAGFKLKHEGFVVEEVEDVIPDVLKCVVNKDKFLKIDESIKCFEDKDNCFEEIVEKILEKREKASDLESIFTEEDTVEEERVTHKEASKSLKILKKYFLQECDDDNINDSLKVCEKFIEMMRSKSLIQSSIHDFLKK